MKTEQLDFEYPEHLVAISRGTQSRVLYLAGAATDPIELDIENLGQILRPGDLIVVNETRVLRRRVFTTDGLEILFLEPCDSERKTWSVLCPSSRWKNGEVKAISATPETTPKAPIELQLIERGRIQKVTASHPLSEADFEKWGELPIPPYIQKARGERHNSVSDATEYQSIWSNPNFASDGSLAAPTASLHFDEKFEEQLKARGVHFAKITLHVGLGTFLPVTVENLEDHVMHSEFAHISGQTIERLSETRAQGGRIVAIGTTVARTLESFAESRLNQHPDGSVSGRTDLMIRPGYQWKMVDLMFTNFHQPRSTLLALVGSFAGLDRVKRAYRWAIEREFRLFSYGDLTVLERAKT